MKMSLCKEAVQDYDVGCLTKISTPYTLLPMEGCKDSSLRLLQTFYPIGISSSVFGMFLYCHECEILLEEVDVIEHFLTHKPDDTEESLPAPADYVSAGYVTIPDEFHDLMISRSLKLNDMFGHDSPKTTLSTEEVDDYREQLEYLLDPIREDLVLNRTEILDLFDSVSRFSDRTLVPGIQTTNHVLECCTCLFYDSKEFKKHVQLLHPERQPPKNFVIVQKLKVSSTNANDVETKTLIFPATDDCNYIIQ